MQIDPEWLETDLYATLGVPPDAGRDEITAAYRRLARELHPDANPDPAAEDRFRAVSTAYDVLRDADKRAAYDRVRRSATGTRRRPGGGYTIRVENLDHIRSPDDAWISAFGPEPGASAADDLLRPRRPRRPGAARARARRGADARASLTLPLADAVAGTTRTIDAPGRVPVAVRIPPGVDDGQTVRVPGQGHPAPGGGAAGDLLVTVHVEPDPIFRRQGRDLTLTVPVSYREAVLGADVTVPTLRGDPVTVRIPAGTPSGRVLRIPGRGIPSADGAGDLLVTVHVDVPTTVDDRQRDLIRELGRYDDPRRRAHLDARRPGPST